MPDYCTAIAVHWLIIWTGLLELILLTMLFWPQSKKGK